MNKKNKKLLKKHKKKLIFNYFYKKQGNFMESLLNFDENELIEKQRRLILEKYGDKDEQGQLVISNGNVNFKENNNLQAAQNELNELANLEIEIIDRNISEDELIKANLELTLNQFSVLQNFIQEK